VSRINLKEAPQGFKAVKYTRPSDCANLCGFRNNDKKCRKAKCSSALREDKSEVIFIEDEI
jgi:hypothetical protein